MSRCHGRQRRHAHHDSDFNGDPPWTADFTGGTGRFAGATGHLLYTVEFTWAPWDNGLPVAPWYANWHWWGTISC